MKIRFLLLEFGWCALKGLKGQNKIHLWQVGKMCMCMCVHKKKKGE